MQKHAERYAPTDVKKGKLLPRWLREPFKEGERVLALAERLKKKEAPKHFYKSTTEKVNSLTASKYLWLEKLLTLPKIITFIGFQEKATIK